MTSVAFDTIFQEEVYQLKPVLTVVIPTEWNALPVEEKNQLTKIVSALKLTLDAVQIMTATRVDLQVIRTYGGIRVIAFGSVLSSDFPLYELQNQQGVSVICADRLDQLDDGKKRTLWLALKQMFSV